MKKNDLKISLPIIVFKEGTSYVAYSPALDLSTSAKTYSKAQERFREAMHVFFEELAFLGTTDVVLADMGWQKIKSNWQPPVVVSNYLEPLPVQYA